MKLAAQDATLAAQAAKDAARGAEFRNLKQQFAGLQTLNRSTQATQEAQVAAR